MNILINAIDTFYQTKTLTLLQLYFTETVILPNLQLCSFDKVYGGGFYRHNQYYREWNNITVTIQNPLSGGTNVISQPLFILKFLKLQNHSYLIKGCIG
jgi:hypothetical protein